MCPPSPSDQNEWRCVLEVFDFNVHPKKLPEVNNPTQCSNLDQASDSGTDKDIEADDPNSGASSTPSSSSSSPPPTRSPTPSSSSTVTHEVSYTVHAGPSSVPASGVFTSDVVSKLPYTHIVRKDLYAMYSGFMIDDERIVGLEVGAVFSLLVRSLLCERLSYL